MAHIDDIERERRLEKIRGKVRARKPSTLKYLKPLRLSTGARLVPLEDEPENHQNADKQPGFVERLPKRVRANYVWALALVTRNGTYLGYIDAQRPPGWAWWKPGKHSAGVHGDNLLEVLDRVLLLTPTPEDVKAVEKLEHAYQIANPPPGGEW